MTNNKPNDVRVVPVELLERIVNLNNSFADHRQAQHDLVKFLAHPADQQGEPIKLSDDVREYLQEGIENATGGEDEDIDHDFAEELCLLLGPIYRHAQPATAKVDENAEFEIWRNDQIESLERMGYPEAAKAFRNLGSVHWTGWQARAKLNSGQS